MRSHDGTAMVCGGSRLVIEGSHDCLVDQTPPQVAAALHEADSADLVEFSYDNVSVYVQPRAVKAIAPTWRQAEDGT